MSGDGESSARRAKCDADADPHASPSPTTCLRTDGPGIAAPSKGVGSFRLPRIVVRESGTRRSVRETARLVAYYNSGRADGSPTRWQVLSGYMEPNPQAARR